MRVGFDASLSSLRSSNSFKIGAWTPVWVQLRGGSAAWSGLMEVNVTDDDGTPTTFRMPVDGGSQPERAIHGICTTRFAPTRVYDPPARSKWPAGRGSVARHGHAAAARVDHAE